MLVIPAIDLSEGKCVRLQRGDMNAKTVFSDEPAEVAQRWANEGAEMIHIVDLDGAFSGTSANFEAVRDIIAAVPIPVELGGGLRTVEQVARVLDAGVKWAILGTAAISNRPELQKCLERFGERIIVGIDARDGRVAVQGWTQTSDVEALELATQMEQLGVGKIIFTDINTDGMLGGPNIPAMKAMAQAVGIPVIASGGVTTLEDIRKLRGLERFGLEGCIVGRALYSGTIALAEAVTVANKV